MKKKIGWLFFLIVIVYCNSYGQSMINGNVKDTLSKTNLENATVILLNAKDSIIEEFTRTDAKGFFKLKSVNAGHYILVISYFGYADYLEKVIVSDPKSDIDLGVLPLALRVNILKEVIVKQTISAIRMRGDTTEYKADSFSVQPNATVEDLLKRLPGLQVDKNGKITAYGETVKTVLVDGEEFFGDDPTLVTHNLRADVVDKVQVYDKKSEFSSATGINDGTKDKTINLKLKEDKKNGYFGKIILAGGINGYHENQGMVNYFKHKMKLAAYGIVSNTGTVGLGWQDAEKYSSRMEETAVQLNDLNSWNGNYDGKGIPLVQTGGIHFNNKWDNDKQTIGFNYKISNLIISGQNNSLQQNILPNAVNYLNYSEEFNNKNFRNKAEIAYEIKLDSSMSLKFTTEGDLNQKETRDAFKTVTQRQGNSILNSGVRKLENSSRVGTNISTLILEKKFRKKGRSISLSLQEVYDNLNSDGHIKAENLFYKGTNIPDSINRIDQMKLTTSRYFEFDTRVTYTEPLTSRLFINIGYGVRANRSNSDIKTFNKGIDSSYSVLDSIYSNHYRVNQFSHRGTLFFNYASRKIRWNIGSDFDVARYSQSDLYNNKNVNRSFTNYYPKSEFIYQISLQRKINFYYNGNTTQPTLFQLQPVLSNNDPLNIYIGNPALTPAYSNTIEVGYNEYKTIDEKYIFSNLNYSFTSNQISVNTFTDSAGKNINQFININGYNRYRGYLGIGRKLAKSNAHIGLNLSINGEKNISFVNNRQNDMHSDSYSLEVYANTLKEKEYAVGINLKTTYTTNASSLERNSMGNNNYWTYEVVPGADLFFLRKMQFHTDANYWIRRGASGVYDNPNAFIWNVWIGKTFMKNDAVLIKLSCNDVLNQNIGFNRSTFNNTISQNYYTIITRYFLLSFTWNFSKSYKSEISK